MDIRVEAHTLLRIAERGTTEEEIRDVLLTGTPVAVRAGRLAKAKVYPFAATRIGKYYDQKRVEVIFVVDGGVLVTITAYVFYGRWD